MMDIIWHSHPLSSWHIPTCGNMASGNLLASHHDHHAHCHNHQEGGELYPPKGHPHLCAPQEVFPQKAAFWFQIQLEIAQSQTATTLSTWRTSFQYYFRFCSLLPKHGATSPRLGYIKIKRIAFGDNQDTHDKNIFFFVHI